MTAASTDRLPIIDMSPLFELQEGAHEVARQHEVTRQIDRACREIGFFYVVGHRIADDIVDAMDRASREFFALPLADKQAIAMARGGTAWRGYFALGDELTSGRPDAKEGIYFGSELAADHPRVRAGWPLHGANLWPERPTGLRPAVEAFTRAATRAGHALMAGISLALGLPADYFHRHYTADPTILFRIFHYPASWPAEWRDSWSVGAHTDYGLLTLLAQDECGGLEVRGRDGWMPAPPIAGALVCNIGDMLDKLTGGGYRSTLHRVMNRSGRGRLSFPLFFDPDFAAPMMPLPERAGQPGQASAGDARWDGVEPSAFEGRYGDYLMSKVAKVFPQLGERYLAAATPD